MVLVEAFEPGETEPGSVIVGIYVGDTIISNDGFAFIELDTPRAELMSDNIREAAKKAEGR